MMKECEDRGDPVDELMKTVDNKQLPGGLEDRLHGQLAAFRERVRLRQTRSFRRRYTRRKMFRRVSVSAAVLLLLALGAYVIGAQTTPTWAEVVERFGTVPFFNATIYVKAHAAADPVQLELWMGPGGKSRFRVGHEVIFGEEGRMLETVAFAPPSADTQRLRYARQMVQHCIERVGKEEAFSFDTLVRALPVQGMLSQPLENQNASISRDLVVFDIADESDPEWTRIWALRGSRLPVRILYWDPESGGSVDVVLSYANEQPEEFFDPGAFRETLGKNAGGAANQAYVLLKDPGGRPITPQDVIELEREKALEPVETGGVDSDTEAADQT